MNPSACLVRRQHSGKNEMQLAKEGFVALLVALWIGGLIAQFGSWTTTAGYLAISMLLVGLIFGDRLVPKRAMARRHRNRE